MFQNMNQENSLSRIKLKKSNSTKSNEDFEQIANKGFIPIFISEMSYFPRNVKNHFQTQKDEYTYV